MNSIKLLLSTKDRRAIFVLAIIGLLIVCGIFFGALTTLEWFVTVLIGPVFVMAIFVLVFLVVAALRGVILGIESWVRRGK